VRIDCEAGAEELDAPAVKQIERIGPFGAGNPRPQVLVRGLRIARRATMGAGGKHLQVWLGLPGGKREWRAVRWGWGELAEQIPVGRAADVVMRPRVSAFSGRELVEPEIVDIAIVPA
jgi:single-stranded-DNA-specific exonuclease